MMGGRSVGVGRLVGDQGLGDMSVARMVAWRP